MISFIIIGRNLSWKITNCLDSVYKAIEFNKLNNFEILYVDSNSKDDTLLRVSGYKSVKTYQINKFFNAATGRNLGAMHAEGDTLFFIDGDMELKPNFLSLVYSEKTGLKYSICSGKWINFNYNESGTLINREEYDHNKFKDSYTFTTGGLFLIRQSVWKKIGGMKAKLKYNEDIDLGIRLAARGFFLHKKREIIAIHHTVPYTSSKRIWKMLFSGAQLYRVVLLRDNFFNKYQWKLFLRENYTFFILLVLLVGSILLVNPAFVLLYFPLLAARSIMRGEKSARLIISNVMYISLYEILFIPAFLLFWPQSRKPVFNLIK